MLVGLGGLIVALSFVGLLLIVLLWFASFIAGVVLLVGF